MQFETRKDLEFIGSNKDYDLRYAAVINASGEEVPITQQMIDQLYERLCAEATIRHTLHSSAA